MHRAIDAQCVSSAAKDAAHAGIVVIWMMVRLLCTITLATSAMSSGGRVVARDSPKGDPGNLEPAD